MHVALTMPVVDNPFENFEFECSIAEKPEQVLICKLFNEVRAKQDIANLVLACTLEEVLVVWFPRNKVCESRT